jgi:CheY-like chemotaxis protein
MVTEDSPFFQRFVLSKLNENPELRVIGEVCDGLEAVQKAVELKPDLILLDIGLPRLNGIEAARRIRKLLPESKIIFSTLNSSPQFVQEAMRQGASGYISKATPIPACSRLSTPSSPASGSLAIHNRANPFENYVGYRTDHIAEQHLASLHLFKQFRNLEDAS